MGACSSSSGCMALLPVRPMGVSVATAWRPFKVAPGLWAGTPSVSLRAAQHLWTIMAEAGEPGDRLAKEGHTALGFAQLHRATSTTYLVLAALHSDPVSKGWTQQSLEILGVSAFQPGSIQLGQPGGKWPPQPGSRLSGPWGVGTDRPPGVGLCLRSWLPGGCQPALLGELASGVVFSASLGPGPGLQPSMCTRQS